MRTTVAVAAAHTWSRSAQRSPPRPPFVLTAIGCVACGGPAPPTADMALHLEDHLDVAVIEGSELPAAMPAIVEWRFDEPPPDWKVAVPLVRPSEDLLPNGSLRGGVYVDLPDWRRGEWADVVVRARAAGAVYNMVMGLNPREVANPNNPGWGAPVQIIAGSTPIVQDGSIHTYRIRPNWGDTPATTPWRRLGLFFEARGPGSVELLSVSVVSKGALYAEAPFGARAVTAGDRIRRTLYTHAPGRLSYRIRVPEAGRLDVGLGVLGEDAPVTFRASVEARGRVEALFEERYADPDEWAQRSVDLSAFAGRTVTLSLEAEAERPGTVALWVAPTVGGARSSAKPNVIFYVIDGGWADDMSVYGYNRWTTPFLERLAAEGWSSSMPIATRAGRSRRPSAS